MAKGHSVRCQRFKDGLVVDFGMIRDTETYVRNQDGVYQLALDKPQSFFTGRGSSRLIWTLVHGIRYDVHLA